MIKNIVMNWSWSSYKPPIVTQNSDGNYIVIDGQHTAIAAASHPTLDLIPAFLVKDLGFAGQAESFIDHNTKRINVTSIQVFKAELAANVDTAMEINMILERFNIKLLPLAAPEGVLETNSITTIKKLYNKHGLMIFRKTMELCAKAELAPIRQNHILAFSQFFIGKNAQKYDSIDKLALTISEIGTASIELRTIAKSRALKITKHDALFEVVKDLYEKRYSLPQEPKVLETKSMVNKVSTTKPVAAPVTPAPKMPQPTLSRKDTLKALSELSLTKPKT